MFENVMVRKPTIVLSKKATQFNKELMLSGFTTLNFPGELRNKMFFEIFTHVRGLNDETYLNSESLSELTDCSMRISDQTWSQKMNRAHRIFKHSLALELLAWADLTIKPLVGREKVIVNSVKKEEALINPNITEESFAIYWRCVRPGKPDAGRSHRDSTFWELEFDQGHDPKIPFQWDFRKDCLKVWIPIAGCETNSALQVIPGSHQEILPTEIAMSEYGLRPTISSIWLAENEHKFTSPVALGVDGHCIIFDQDTVHRGPVNQNKFLRISAEFNLIFK